ncbi:hypothetical protein F5Y03DRAFT_390360 [Xylaria venustula]|nr:hypothetical protein F5Y03DRAFT_390360 [Xylaria venustula]
MLEPGAIISIIGGSLGIVLTLVKLASKSPEVHQSREHLEEVRRQRRILRHRLRNVEAEIGTLRGINAQGVRHLRDETRNLIGHSRRQIEKFDRFYDRFTESQTVRGWHYISISAGGDTISKYEKRFEVYLDWIIIAQLSIALTPISERRSFGSTSVSSLNWRDISRLRDELDHVRRAQRAHPGRLRKLRVNKGVDLSRLERYADGLVLRFDNTVTATESSVLIVDDLPHVPARYTPVSDTWDQYNGHSRVTELHPQIDRSSWTAVVHDDLAHNIPRAPPNVYTSVTRSKPDTSRYQDDRRSKHSRSRSRTGTVYREPSGSRGSVTLTPGSRHDGGDEWNAAPIPQRGHRSRERHGHSVSGDQVYTMTSGFGRSESVEGSQHSHRRRQSASRSDDRHSRPHSRQSHRSERGSDQEVRGRDTRRRDAQDRQQNAPLRQQPQSTSRHSSRHSSHHTDARQHQQRRDSGIDVEIHPAPRRHSSRASNTSSRPSHDSGYGSLAPERYSSSASNASTRRRSSSRPSHRKQYSQFENVDRSRPPIALDRAEEGIRKAEKRLSRTNRRVS